MTTSTRYAAPVRFLIVAGILATSAFAMALPTFAHAATYAFVNTSGEVSAVVANDPQTAMMTALNISIHSGVLLLTSQSDTIMGDGVGGV